MFDKAISSHSLGRAWVHDMPSKLDQAAHYGFDIELFFEDLLYVAKAFPGGATSDNFVKAAHKIRSLCDERGIAVICLQPFMHYEGLRDRTRHAQRIDEMRQWIQLAKILGTNLIAIPSTFLPDELASGDRDLITRDMIEVADLGLPDGIEFAYEALCWGTHTDTWEQSWEIVKRVDRPNFKICLDTFNIAGRIYADPTSPDGKRPNADAELAASLRRLVKDVDVRKIAFVQVVDAERLKQPLVEGHKFHHPEQCPRMSWSRNCRLFYGEEDRAAYLPIKAILKAILVDMGFQGYLSAELFNRSLTDASPSVPREHAGRAAESWQKMVADFGLDGLADHSIVTRTSIEQRPRAQL